MASTPEELFLEYAAITDTAVKTATLSERLAACMLNVGTLLESLNRVAEYDSETNPELRSAVGHAAELQGAIERAHTFVVARYEVALERMHALATKSHEKREDGNAEA